MGLGELWNWKAATRVVDRAPASCPVFSACFPATNNCSPVDRGFFKLKRQEGQLMLISTEPCKLELETLVVNCDDCMSGTEGRPPLGVRGPVLRCRGRGVNGHAWRRFRVPLSSERSFLSAGRADAPLFPFHLRPGVIVLLLLCSPHLTCFPYIVATHTAVP